MAKVKWYREGSKDSGWIYYKKHPTRKHGIPFDKYRRAEYQHQGKRISINFGWESKGWTLLKCQGKLQEYKKNAGRYQAGYIKPHPPGRNNHHPSIPNNLEHSRLDS